MPRAEYDTKVRLYHTVAGVRDASPYSIEDGRRVEARDMREDGPFLFTRELYFTSDTVPTNFGTVTFTPTSLKQDFDDCDQCEFANQVGVFYRCVRAVRVTLLTAPYYQVHIRPMPYP